MFLFLTLRSMTTVLHFRYLQEIDWMKLSSYKKNHTSFISHREMHYCRRKMAALYLHSTSKGEGSYRYRDYPTHEECILAMASRGKQSEKA